MGVQFILGRSGIGKTNYCIREIVSALIEPEERPLIFLVPEQATYLAERAILADKRIAGYSRLSVLSFDRLQFLLLGKNTARPALSRIGQQMIIHKLVRDNRDKLKIFDPSANWPGLAYRIAQTIVELHQYAKTPEDIETLQFRLQKDRGYSFTVQKLGDINVILKEYLRFIEGRFIDPDIQLTHSRQAIQKAPFVKGAKLWVDGFSGFCAGELAVLGELLKVVAETKIAICLDPSKVDFLNPDVSKLDPISLFYPTEKTYAELIKIIREANLELSEPILLEKVLRFTNCPQLAYVEQNIFSGYRTKGTSKKTNYKTVKERKAVDGKIHIVSAANERAEVQFVARQIQQLVRQKGYRYRDIAVIASDINHYEHYVNAYFSDHNIPFFIDKRRLLNQHPVIQLVCSALRAVTGGLVVRDVFAYLKNDLVPLERYEVDILENYCLAFGINAGDWQSEQQWHFAGEDNQDFDQEHINQIRLKAIGPLLTLQNELCPRDNPSKTTTAKDFTRIIFAFLDDLEAREKVSEWVDEANKRRAGEAGFVQAASGGEIVNEHQQFFERFLDIFDELVEVFAEREMTVEDYSAIISSAFSQLTLACIPPSLDQVLVSSIERSRHPDLKAVFIIGATQKDFPVPVGADGVLSDSDRIAAESLDFQLAPSIYQMFAERMYLAYIAFTRPSELLYITYSVLDEKGSEIIRSQFIDELESLFTNLEEETTADQPGGIEDVLSGFELSDFLCRQLSKDATKHQRKEYDSLVGLVKEIRSDEQMMEIGEAVASAVDYDNSAELSSEVVTEFFERPPKAVSRAASPLRSSATRLGTFAACHYRYFARYVLKLEKRAEFKFEPLDFGNFYHIVLDALIKRLNEQGQDFAKIENEQLIELLRQEISKLLIEHPFISRFARRSAHNVFIINSAAEILEDFVVAMAEMIRASRFRPKLSEVSFGEVEKSCIKLGEYETQLPSGRLLALDGIIDRLDVAELDGKNVAIIFDYKRKKQTFNWSEFYYGLDMQLPIYLLAVKNAYYPTGMIDDIVGAFYMPVEIDFTLTTFSELQKMEEKFPYKAKGIFNGEYAQHLEKAMQPGWSKFYNFYVLKQGAPYGCYHQSGALKTDDFDRVLKFTRNKSIDLAEKIVCGRIDVKPYWLNGVSPCRYCEYRSVCRFDWQINDYNFLESVNKLQVLEKIDIDNG